MERIKPKDYPYIGYFNSTEGVFSRAEDHALHRPIWESFGWGIYDPFVIPPEIFVRTLLGDLDEQIK